MQFSGHGILLDIEGTTSSISFVYETMFPYVREHLESFLRQNWQSPRLAEVRDTMAVDASRNDFVEFCGSVDSVSDEQTKLREEVLRLMDTDKKTTGLKMLQGLVWKAGFESGQLVAHVYEDVVPALRRWNDLGMDVRIYSSGSVAAQQLFFGHTEGGDVLNLFSSHYDTTTGPKKESTSYGKIAEDFGCPAPEILFISDVIAELDAAVDAGMATALSIRPGNAPVEAGHPHPEIHTFTEVEAVVAS
jgi:enolase-phosphatase E1